MGDRCEYDVVIVGAGFAGLYMLHRARGLGLSARMLAALEAEARAQGVETVRLYTNGSLTEARALYGSRGYAEIPRYNDDPYAQHWFEKRL